MLIHKPFGVGRAQVLLHLDGPRLAILLALPTEPRAHEPTGGRRKCTCRDPAEKPRQRRMYLVGVNPARYAQHVRDVLRASAGGACCSDGRTVQAGEGPIPVLSRARRLQQRVTEGLRALERWWEGAQVRSSFSSQESIEETRPVVALREGTNSSRSACAIIGACKGAKLTATLLPLASLAIDQEMFFGLSKWILEAALLPSQTVTFGNLVCRAQARGHRGQQEFRAALFQRAMPCQHCAVVATIRKRQLEGMWSSVLAGSERTLLLQSGGKCSEGSSSRRPGPGEAVWSSAQASPTVAVDAPTNSMMMFPTAGAVPSWPARIDCRPLLPPSGNHHKKASST